MMRDDDEVIVVRIENSEGESWVRILMVAGSVGRDERSMMNVAIVVRLGPLL